MDDNEIRLEILKAAHEYYLNRSSADPGPMGMDFSDADLVNKISDIGRDDIIRGIEYWEGQGYLETKRFLADSGGYYYCCKITSPGIDFLEGRSLFTPAYIVQELTRADLDSDTKKDLEELIKRFDESLQVLKGLIDQAAKVAEKNPDAHPFVKLLAGLAGNFTAEFTKRLAEP